MNRNGVVAVVLVVAAVVLAGLWVMRAGQPRRAGFGCADPPPAPGTPSHAVTGDAVALNWAPPQGDEPVTTYVIEAGTAPGLNDQGTFVVPGSTTSFLREHVPAGTYSVRVLARNDCGMSAPSESITIVVAAP